MKFPSLSNLGSVVAFATVISGCDKPDIVADAGVNGVTNEAGMNVTDAGVPEIHSQIDGIKAALAEVMKTAHETETNYAGHAGEDPLIDEPFVAGREEYNSSFKIDNFKLNDTVPGVYVRRYNPTDSTIIYNSMSARVQTPLGANQTEYGITLSEYVAQVPPPADDLSKQFDITRKEYVGESYTSTEIHFAVHHGDVNALDAGATDMGVANLDYVVDGCSYVYSSNLGVNNIPNNRVELPSGSEECNNAAIVVLKTLNTILTEHKVCSGVLDNLSTREVTPETCH